MSLSLLDLKAGGKIRIRCAKPRHLMRDCNILEEAYLSASCQEHDIDFSAISRAKLVKIGVHTDFVARVQV